MLNPLETITDGRPRTEGLDHLLIVLSSQDLFDAGVEAILRV